MRHGCGLVLVVCLSCGKSSTLPAPYRGTAVEEVVAEALDAARAEAIENPAAESLGLYGRLLHGHGWYREAAECYARAAALAPDAFRWPYLRGIALATVNPVASLAALEQAVLLDPAYTVGRYKTALLCIECEQTDAAREHLQAALRQDPGHVPSLLALGRIHLGAQDADQARLLLQDALTRMPDHPEVHETLARVFFRLQDDTRARYHAEQAQRHRRSVPIADPRADLDLPAISSKDHLERGVAEAGRQNLDQAKVHFQRALDLRPDSFEALYNLAVVHQDLGDPGTAEAFYRRCLEMREGDLASGRRLVDLLEQSGRAREAYELVNGWIAKDPDSADWHLAAAQVSVSAGQTAAAVVHARNARQRAGNDRAILRQCAQILGRAQALADAVTCWEELVRLDEEDREARVQLGILLGRQGELERAIQHFDRVLARQPNHELAKTNLVTACQALATQRMQDGNTVEAIALFERVLSLRADLVASLRGLAWILATTSDDALRNPERALALAEQAAAEADQPVVWDTLAAALASCGRFDEAVIQAQKALEGARAQGKSEQVARIQKRLALYQQGQAFRTSDGR